MTKKRGTPMLTSLLVAACTVSAGLLGGAEAVGAQDAASLRPTAALPAAASLPITANPETGATGGPLPLDATQNAPTSASMSFLAIEGFGLWWTDAENPFDRLAGVGLAYTRTPATAVGVDARLAYFFPSGFYRAVGISGVLGVSRALGISGVWQVSAGAAGLLGGDNDGTPIIAGGPYWAMSATKEITRGFALRGEAFVRVYVVSGEVVPAPGLTFAIGRTRR